MAEFINTVDVIGDEALIDSIIDRTVTEYKDDTIETVGNSAFNGCTELAIVDMPNVANIGDTAFKGCTALATVDAPNATSIGSSAFYGSGPLIDVNFPNVTTIGNEAFRTSKLTKAIFPNATDVSHNVFREITTLTEADFPELTSVGHNMLFGCSKLNRVNLPKMTYIPGSMMSGCGSLDKVNIPNATSIAGGAFQSCPLKMLDCPKVTRIDNGNTFGAFNNRSILTALILRSETMCTLGGNASFGDFGATYPNTAIAAGTGYIYVPRALIEDYKVATNWVNYATQFRALEDYTADGTVNGTFKAGYVSCYLTDVLSTNGSGFVLLDSYQTTLSSMWGTDMVVSVTMNGVDVTADVYNAETHEIVIPEVAGNVVITASCDAVVDGDLSSLPTLYNLPNETEFNGTSDYIDTGIKLFDTAKDFTIIVKASFNTLASEKTLFHCMNESSPYPGVCVDGNSGVRIVYTNSTTSIESASNVSALALRYSGGKINMIRYRNTAGQIVSHNISGTPAYTPISQNLLIGAYQQTNGQKGRFFNGTINAFKVYDFALPAKAVDQLLTAL